MDVFGIGDSYQQTWFNKSEKKEKQDNNPSIFDIGAEDSKAGDGIVSVGEQRKFLLENLGQHLKQFYKKMNVDFESFVQKYNDFVEIKIEENDAFTIIQTSIKNAKAKIVEEIIKSKSENSLETNDISFNSKLNMMLDGDYSDFTKIEYTTINGTQETLKLLEEFKLSKGISLYQDIINQYKEGNLSREDFKQNIRKLLDIVYFDLKYPNIDEEMCFLDCDLHNIIAKIKSDEFNLDDFNNFNFDKYVENITLPQATTIKKAKELERYDITDSQIASMLPKIDTKEIDVNTVSQKINDISYIINYSENGITVKDFNDKEYTINYNKLLDKIPNNDDKNKVITILKNLPASVLIDLSIEIDYIKIFYNKDTATCAQYDGADNTVSINLSKNEDINLNSALAHEIGHALDHINIKRLNKPSSGYDKKFIKIAAKELQKLKDRPEYERQYATSNLVEMFAECYALLQTGNSADSNYVIANYFPETLAYVQNKIEQIRRKSYNKRHYVSEKEEKIKDILYNNKIPSWY